MTRLEEAEALLRLFVSKHTDQWRDWNGGNTGDCPCRMCKDARAFLAALAPVKEEE